jgi:hypothetical protein
MDMDMDNLSQCLRNLDKLNLSCQINKIVFPIFESMQENTTSNIYLIILCFQYIDLHFKYGEVYKNCFKD